MALQSLRSDASRRQLVSTCKLRAPTINLTNVAIFGTIYSAMVCGAKLATGYCATLNSWPSSKMFGSTGQSGPAVLFAMPPRTNAGIRGKMPQSI